MSSPVGHEEWYCASLMWKTIGYTVEKDFYDPGLFSCAMTFIRGIGFEGCLKRLTQNYLHHNLLNGRLASSRMMDLEWGLKGDWCEDVKLLTNLMMVKPPPKKPSLLLVCFWTSVQPKNSDKPPMPPNLRSDAFLTGKSEGWAASNPPLIQANCPNPAFDNCSAAAKDLPKNKKLVTSNGHTLDSWVHASYRFYWRFTTKSKVTK